MIMDGLLPALSADLKPDRTGDGPQLPVVLQRAGIAGDPPLAPLWRAALRGGSLARRGVARHAVRAMLKRRRAAAGLPAHLTPHSFRVMVVTALLNQNVPVEEVQHLVGHSHPSTTQLYDRRRRRINRSIVERIPYLSPKEQSP